MAVVKMATTLVTAVSAAQAAAVFKYITDRGPTAVVTPNMAHALAITRHCSQCCTGSCSVQRYDWPSAYSGSAKAKREII
jgi:hypothetical protein